MIANCPHCNQKLRFNITDESREVKLRCPTCGNTFLLNLSSNTEKKAVNRKCLLIALSLLAVVIFFTIREGGSFIAPVQEMAAQLGITSEYTTISYGHLVNKSVLTHDGESVGQVISKLITNPESEHLMALIQPYMEPFSALCNAAIPVSANLRGKAMTNILSFYPEGSAQPAWAAITREGHFQIYFNNTKIRVFLKGSSPRASFTKYHSVVRHPIHDIIISSNGHFKTIEVYAFNNDYSKTELNLNLKPYVLDANEFHFEGSSTLSYGN